jgi:hypothetical protein
MSAFEAWSLIQSSRGEAIAIIELLNNNFSNLNRVKITRKWNVALLTPPYFTTIYVQKFHLLKKNIY